MELDEVKKASDALCLWFVSQEISPADGGHIMIYLMATQLVAKSREVNDLQKGINCMRDLLTLEVAECLHD